MKPKIRVGAPSSELFCCVCCGSDKLIRALSFGRVYDSKSSDATVVHLCRACRVRLEIELVKDRP